MSAWCEYCGNYPDECTCGVIEETTQETNNTEESE